MVAYFPTLPIFKAIYRLPPGGVNATKYKSTAFDSLNVGKYVVGMRSTLLVAKLEGGGGGPRPPLAPPLDK